MDLSALTTEQLEELHQALERDRLQLEEHFQLTKEGSKPVQLGTPIGRLSRMDAIQQQQMTRAGRTSVDIKLRQVRASLEAPARRSRRENGSGRCRPLVCGSDRSTRRRSSAGP